MIDNDLTEVVREKLYDLICAGGGDASTLQTAAEDIVAEVKEALGTGDRDASIGEDAFKAGFKACAAWLEPAYADAEPTAKGLEVMEKAWSDYDPPEALKGGGDAEA